MRGGMRHTSSNTVPRKLLIPTHQNPLEIRTQRIYIYKEKNYLLRQLRESPNYETLDVVTAPN